jgi:hypothetical protein
VPAIQSKRKSEALAVNTVWILILSVLSDRGIVEHKLNSREPATEAL